MPADPWAVTSVTPVPQAAPPPAGGGGGDPWAVTSHTPMPTAPAATQPSRGIGGVADWMEQNPMAAGGSSVAAGALKSAAGGLGGIMDMVSRPKMPTAFSVAYQQEHPGSTQDEAEKAYGDAYRKTFGGKISGHIQDAANWLRTGSEAHGFWENVGALGEQVMEYMGTDGLLKMVGPAAGAMETGEHLKQAQQAAQVLKNNPKLAGLVTVGLKASKEAAMQAAQTYAHTEDTGQALAAGAVGGGMHMGGEAAAAGLSKAAQWARRVGPQVLDIAGEKVPALASQLNERGVPIETGAAAAPKIGQAQQMAGPAVVESVAKSAARNAIDRINATRVYETNPARLLPAAAEGEPPTFTVGLGGKGVERQEGELMQSAAKRPQAAFKQPQYVTGSAPTRRPLGMVEEGPLTQSAAAQRPTSVEGQMGADISTATTPEPRQDILGGTPSMKTNDPAEAEGWLSQLKKAQEHPLYDKLPQAQKDALEESRRNLEHQLGMYHASQPTNYPLRMPVDMESAVGQVRDFGDAADQIKGAARPVFANFDSASSGELNDQFSKYNQALRNMRTATGAGYDQAEKEMNEADQAINNLMTAHAGNVSRDEYQTARMAWRDASRLDQLHTVVSRMMNGVTAKEAAETGATQFMRRDVAHTRALENFLSKSQNRAQLEGLIGTDGVQNLKNMTKLLSSPQLAGATKETLMNVARELGKHAAISSIGAAAAHFLGVPATVGASAGAMTAGMRYVMHAAVTDPRVGQLLEYAARQGVDKKVYAPLIARTIMVPTQEQQPQEGQQ